MKKISLLLVPILGIVLGSDVEARGRFTRCPKGMVKIPTDTASGYVCGYRTIEPVGPPPPPIVIQSFEPASAFPGDTITIRGSGFSGGVIQSIHFNSADPARMEVVSATELKVTLPPSAEPGPVRINSYPEKRVSSVTSAEPYPVRTDIVVTRVEPSQGKPGTPIKIYVRNTHKTIGEYQDRGRCELRIGGIEESTFYPMSSNLDLPVQRTVPAGAKHGEIAIDCGRGKSTKSNLFQLIAEKPVEKAPEAKITSIYPPGGIEKNNQITIFGTQLQKPKEVTFNGKKGSINTSSSDLIRVIVPNMDGVTKIVVVTPQGSASWDNYNIFKSQPPPEWKPPTPPVAEKPTPPPAPTPPKVDPITKNALGNPELCFGAVGKGCGGFGDLKEDDKNASRPGWLAAGCSKEVDGKRRCWVVPGSIKHDNCCVGHPHGKHCGGPMSDGSNAGEWNHDGNCDKEWDDSVWDVKNGRGWEFDFVAKEPGDLTPASSPDGRYSGGERAGTVGLCAPDDTSISARHNVAFCCSGNAKKYWALGVEDWYICERRSGRSVQQIGGKEEGIPSQFDMSKSPSKPGEPKQQPVAVVKKPEEVAPVITKAPATVNTEESIAIYGKNFIRINGKSEMSNFKEVFWVKGNLETKAQGVSAVGNPGEEDRINIKAPKEAGNYSLKVVTAKGVAIWNKPLISVQSPGPVITKAPATANAEESIAIYGKNFIRINGKTEMSNFKEVFWVKDKTETKAQGVSAVGNPGEEDRINIKAPKEAGDYSLKVVTAKGTALWNNPFVSVQSMTPVITKAPASAEAEGDVTIHGKNFIRINGKMEMSNVKQVLWVKGRSEIYTAS